MKNKIFALALLAVIALAGCDAQGQAGIQDNTAGREDAQEPVSKCNGQVDKLMALALPILEYEANTASKLMLENALEKISQLSQRVAEVEGAIDGIGKLEFKGKEEYLSANRELVELTKKLMEKYRELYNFELDLKEKEALAQKLDKTEDLHLAIVNCRCGEVDCESYKDSSLKFMEESARIFTRIKEKYGLEAFGKAAGEWAKDRETAEKHWPGLIKKSKSYGDRCYRINEAYSEYLNDIDQAERVTESEIADAVSRKWLLSLMNLASELDELAVDIDSARAGVEA